MPTATTSGLTAAYKSPTDVFFDDHNKKLKTLTEVMLESLAETIELQTILKDIKENNFFKEAFMNEIELSLETADNDKNELIEINKEFLTALLEQPDNSNLFVKFYEILYKNEQNVPVNLLDDKSDRNNLQSRVNILVHVAAIYNELFGKHSFYANKRFKKAILSSQNLKFKKYEIKYLEERENTDLNNANDKNSADRLLFRLLVSKSERWLEDVVFACLYAHDDKIRQIVDTLLPELKSNLKELPEFAKADKDEVLVKVGEWLLEVKDKSLVALRVTITNCVEQFLKVNSRSHEIEDDISGSVSNLEIRNVSNKNKQEKLPFDLDIENINTSAETSKEKFALRRYQEVLAAPGLRGENSVVIAPTGSGKTHVSIKITEQILSKNSEARIAFLAGRTNLVHQQYEQFRRFLPRKIQMVLLTGGDSEKIPLKNNLANYNVIVLSTQIFLNALQNTGEDGLDGDITKFKLIVFDECHHCNKNDPMKKIMDIYFDCKEQGKGPLPLLLGLTASPGTEKAKNSTDAFNHVMRLCSNLDCHSLITISEEERKLLSNIRDIIHPTDSKINDIMNVLIDKLMEKAETYYKAAIRNKVADKDSLLPGNRGDANYTNFLGNLRNRITSFTNDEDANSIFACWKYLEVYHISLRINRLFRCKDALEYITTNLDNPDLEGADTTCPVAEQLKKDLENVKVEMVRYSETPPAKTNPSLEKLKEIILSQFTEKRDSRGIVFVKQRLDTIAMKSYIESCPELADIGCDNLTGANADGASGGTTQNLQNDILAKFKNGDIKLLVSTSVAEEGLDVPQCNLVIRYCYVTNEIAMVQSKGRGRTEDSTYHLIINEHDDWMEKKENMNKDRDKMMMAAVDKISHMDRDKFLCEINLIQREDSLRRQSDKIEKLKKRQVNSAQLFEILCFSCNRVLSSSKKLRLAQSIHHLVLDEVFFLTKLRAERGCTPRVFSEYEIKGVALLCHCSHKVANLIKFRQGFYPELLITAVIFKNVETGVKMPPAKKWKKVKDDYLVIEDISNEDELTWAAVVPDIPEFMCINDDPLTDT